MKVLINGLSAKFGGGELYLQKLLENLEDEIVDITLYCPPNFKVPQKKQITKVVYSKKLSNALIRPMWERFKLPKILKEGNFDLLFSPGGTSSTPRSQNFKTVITFQNMLPFSYETLRPYRGSMFYIKMKLLEWAMIRSFQKADLTIFISKYAKNVIESIVGASLKAKTVIYHGVVKYDTTQYKRDQKPYLLYVSVLTPYKNQLPVIKAFAKLKETGHYEGQLILAGKNDTTYGKMAIKLVTSLGLEEDIIFTGNLSADQLVSYYANAQGFIFASECENCPNILLEKLSFNRPVATSNMGPMDEIAQDYALYFNPRDDKDILRSLKVLVSQEYIQNYSKLKAPKLNTWNETARETWKKILECAE